MQTTLKVAALWGIGFLVFTVLDLLWIGVVAARVYRAEVGPLLVLGDGMTAPRIAAALTTWLLITLAIVHFAQPHMSQSTFIAFSRGALMGLVIYGVYDLTNYAVLRGWTLKMTLLDIAWGTFACGVTSLALNRISLWFFSFHRTAT